MTTDLEKFTQALMAPLEGVYDLVREREDGTPGWSIAFDPDNAPAEALPWLAQFVGVRITPEMTTEQIRLEIKEPTGWARGRPDSIKTAAGRGLTGSKLVIVKPRMPVVGVHYVRTLLSETPDPARTEATIRAALPAWEVLDYEAFTGMTWADVIAKHADWADVIADNPTWSDLIETEP
jgi:hypothetical protein